jgi:hypothetical protein
MPLTAVSRSVRKNPDPYGRCVLLGLTKNRQNLWSLHEYLYSSSAESTFPRGCPPKEGEFGQVEVEQRRAGELFQIPARRGNRNLQAGIRELDAVGSLRDKHVKLMSERS